MLGDGKWNSGDQGSFFKYQYGVLKLLESINAGIAGLPGVDYELIYTSYKANANGVGPCAGKFSTGDFIQRIDIVNAATGAITSTVWFNETTGNSPPIAPCIPPISSLDPYTPPSNITVSNPFNLEATQQLVKNNVTSKINRIKGAADYNRALTYFAVATPGSNVTSIVHTGTTLLGVETITETFTYDDVTIAGSNVTNIAYT